MLSRLACVAAIVAAAGLALAADPAPTASPPINSPTGGANSPKPGPAHKLILDTAELSAGSFSVQIPTGNYTAPAGGAENYSVPAPIIRFKGADGIWRGHGYLETYPRLIAFKGTADKTSATLTYTFENNKNYTVKLAVKGDAIHLDEESSLGPRNVWVFDCFYGDKPEQPWAPAAGFALDATGTKHAFLYLPCFYDKPEATVNPAHKPTTADAAPPADGEPATPAKKPDPIPPHAVAVTSSETAQKDVVGFWAVDPTSWKNGDAMGFQLWQRRQHPSDPASRHFLGPDTKSDSTPNPRTANLLGTSLYEGHVTMEFNLGVGTRKIAFTAQPKGADKKELAEPFKKVVQSNQK